MQENTHRYENLMLTSMPLSKLLIKLLMIGIPFKVIHLLFQ